MGDSLRVLIVDDYKDAAESLAMILRIFGFQVDLAGDCPGAENAVKANPPDVVLMDIGLPGCDGYTVTRQLRALFKKQPLLIALTGHGACSDYRRSTHEGFDHHLVKPVDPEKLVQLLKDHVKMARPVP